jgi:hypothetical protein
MYVGTLIHIKLIIPIPGCIVDIIATRGSISPPPRERATWAWAMGKEGGNMRPAHIPAFAPCHVKGLTTKNRCIAAVAVAVAVGVATLCPGAAAIVWRAIPPLWNQSPLQPALNPQSPLLSPPHCRCLCLFVIASPLPENDSRQAAGCRLLSQRYPCRGNPLPSPRWGT